MESWWTFRQGLVGTFEYYACCFVETQQSGNYAILESDEGMLVLELFNRQGHIQRMSVSRDTTAESRIKIDPAGPFIRTGP